MYQVRFDREAANNGTGPLFGEMNRPGHVLDKRLSGEAVAMVLKLYVWRLGHSVEDFAEHGVLYFDWLVIYNLVLRRSRRRDTHGDQSSEADDRSFGHGCPTRRQPVRLIRTCLIRDAIRPCSQEKSVNRLSVLNCLVRARRASSLFSAAS